MIMSRLFLLTCRQHPADTLIKEGVRRPDVTAPNSGPLFDSTAGHCSKAMPKHTGEPLGSQATHNRRVFSYRVRPYRNPLDKNGCAEVPPSAKHLPQIIENTCSPAGTAAAGSTEQHVDATFYAYKTSRYPQQVATPHPRGMGAHATY